MFYFNKVIWPCTYYKIFRGVCVCVCVCVEQSLEAMEN